MSEPENKEDEIKAIYCPHCKGNWLTCGCLDKVFIMGFGENSKAIRINEPEPK